MKEMCERCVRGETITYRIIATPLMQWWAVWVVIEPSGTAQAQDQQTHRVLISSLLGVR